MAPQDLSELSRPGMVAPSLSYVICTAPRTGSSLLASALDRTGVAGHPAEYFDAHARNEDVWRRRLGIGSEAEYWDKVVSAGTTPNGVFGLKLHQHQWPALRRRLGPPDAEATHLDELMRARLGDVRYIWLRRRNKIAQGISYSRAVLTDEWWRDAKRPTQDRQKPPEPVFDYDHVDRHVRLVREFDDYWLKFFRQHRVPALVLVYEDFVAAYEDTVRGVLRFLGVPETGAAIPAPGFERQADDRSLDWERRYQQKSQPGPGPAPDPVPPAEEAAKLPLVAYDVSGRNPRPIIPAPVPRKWMDATPYRFAYRCLPMLIANQSGWLVLNTQPILISWTGGDEPGAVTLQSLDGNTPYVADSHFGSGIVTFHMDFLFRTPPGYNLLVRGPVNTPKDGIYPLDGIVESDWSEATFTMNWKLTRPNHAVAFEKDEPIAMIAPVRRGELERFEPTIQRLSDRPALEAGYQEWCRSRLDFNAGLKVENSDARRIAWQRHYLQGRTVAAQPAPEHQTGLALAEFHDARSGGSRGSGGE